MIWNKTLEQLNTIYKAIKGTSIYVLAFTGGYLNFYCQKNILKLKISTLTNKSFCLKTFFEILFEIFCFNIIFGGKSLICLNVLLNLTVLWT